MPARAADQRAMEQPVSAGPECHDIGLPGASIGDDGRADVAVQRVAVLALAPAALAEAIRWWTGREWVA